MFTDTRAFSSFAVDDVEKARAFYGDTLGITITEEMDGILVLNITVDRPTLIYPKPDFEPATYTILNFPVDDIDAAVTALTERGVEMLRYDEFEQDDNGVARANGGGPDIAWFKDPAGNILAVLRPV